MTYRATLKNMRTGLELRVHKTATSIPAARQQGYEATKSTSHPYLWRVIVKEER